MHQLLRGGVRRFCNCTAGQVTVGQRTLARRAAALGFVLLAGTATGCSSGPKVIEPGDWRLSFRLVNSELANPADKIVQLTLHSRKDTKQTLVRIQYVEGAGDGASTDEATTLQLVGPLEERLNALGEKFYEVRLDGFDQFWTLVLKSNVVSEKAIRGNFAGHDRLNVNRQVKGDWKLTRIDPPQ